MPRFGPAWGLSGAGTVVTSARGVPQKLEAGSQTPRLVALFPSARPALQPVL